MITMNVLTKKKVVLVGLMLTSLTKICSAIDCQDKETTIPCMCPDKYQECEENANAMQCRTEKHGTNEKTECAGECPISLLTPFKQMILCGNHCAETCEECIWKLKPGQDATLGEGLCSRALCVWKNNACKPKTVQCSASDTRAISPADNAESFCDDCLFCDTMPEPFTSDPVVQCEIMPELTDCDEKKAEVKEQRCKPIGLGLSRPTSVYLKYKVDNNFNLNPGGAGFWWYQQVTPTSQEPSTYFKVFEFTRGYGGIQQLCGEECEKNGEGKGLYIMSMWNGKIVINIDDKHPDGMIPPDKATPEAIKAETNSSSVCDEFKGEGKGGRCRLFVGAAAGDYFPKIGEPYHMVMHCEPLMEELQCTMYYYFNKKWHLLARMKQDKIIGATDYGSMSSFVEQFSPLGIQKEQPVESGISADFGPPFINNQKNIGENKVDSTGFNQVTDSRVEYNLDWNYKHVTYEQKSSSISIGTGHSKNKSTTPCWGSEKLFNEISKSSELELFETKIRCLTTKKHQAGQAGRISITECLHDTVNQKAEGKYELTVTATVNEFKALRRKRSLHEITAEIKFVYGQVLYDMMIDFGKEKRFGGGWRNVEKVNNTNQQLWIVSAYHRYQRGDGGNWDILKNEDETWYHRFPQEDEKSVIKMKINVLCISGDCGKDQYFTDIFNEEAFNEGALKYMNDETILNKFQQFKIEKFSQITFIVDAIKKIETPELTDSVPTMDTFVPTLVSSTSVQQASLPSNPKSSRKRKGAKKQNERAGKSPKKAKKRKAQWLGKKF